MNDIPKKGKVYLVGAGPGDPGLITLRGKFLLERAEAVVYDHLANVKLLAHAPAEAELIYVGKKSNQHTLPQEGINRLLVELGLAGKRVVRLKGGDPFIFGRGGEEVEHLQEAGIPVTVVNGITAGLAAVSSLNVPLTHREHAHGVVFVTGHAKPGDSGTDWATLAHCAREAKLTLVIYMGISSASAIQAGLLQGLPASTPAAIVQRASLPQQRHAACTLAQLVDTLQAEQLGSPSILVVGDVISGLAQLQDGAEGARQAA